jgi:hypothetical protein
MKKIIRYLITLGIGLAIILIIILSKRIFGMNDPKMVYKALTDAFFTAGVLIFGFGLLIVASNGGTFEMLTYGVQKMFDLFRRDLTNVKHKTFYDYHLAKQDSKLQFFYLIAVGLFYIGLSFLFLWLYYHQ